MPIFAHIIINNFFNASVNFSKVDRFSVKVHFGLLNWTQNLKVQAITVSDHHLDVLINIFLCYAVNWHIDVESLIRI